MWAVSPMWSYSFCMSFGLVKGWNWKRLFLDTAGLVAQFQCRLFLLVQALIFGVLVGILGLCFEVFGTCRSGFGVLFLVILVLRLIGWERCGHGLTSRLRETSSVDFLDKLLVLFGYPVGLLLLYWLVTYLFGSVIPGLLGNCPLGDFLIGVVFVIWLLIVLMVLGFLVMIGWVGICFLLLLVVLVILLMIGFWGALKEFETEKHLHTLHELETP